MVHKLTSDKQIQVFRNGLHYEWNNFFITVSMNESYIIPMNK